jgi:hypothetical protein
MVAHLEVLPGLMVNSDYGMVVINSNLSPQVFTLFSLTIADFLQIN